MRIRRTLDEDAIWALHKKTLPSDEQYKRKKNYYWLAYKGDKPVGFGILTDLGHKIGFLSRSGVLPCARGKGLQKKLIRARVNHAKKIGPTCVITYASMDNIASSRHLIQCGFELYLPDYAYVGNEFLYFIKYIR